MAGRRLKPVGRGVAPNLTPTRSGAAWRPELVGVALLCLTLGACVAGSSEASHAAAGGELSAFFLGLWHGIIGPVTLIVEVINHFAPHALPWKVRLYQPGDTGWAYDLGFYLGLVGSPLAVGSRWR